MIQQFFYSIQNTCFWGQIILNNLFCFILFYNLKFSFVHIDVDLYQPTLDCLEFFFPKLVSGGIIVCDDYNSSQFPGAKNAWDYYFKDKKINLFYEQPFGGCFLIK